MANRDTHAERVRERLSPRANPRQDRSRVSLQALLDAAEEVIAESGLQGLAMREVARRANLKIASVYHYFPSTAALIRALIERQLGKLRCVLETGLQTRFPTDAADVGREELRALLVEQMGGFVDDFAAFFFNTPSASKIWGGLQAYPDLQTLDIEDKKKNAALIQAILTRFIPSLEPEQAPLVAMVFVESVTATVRFAAALPPDARVQVVGALKSFVSQWLTGLLQTASAATQTDGSDEGCHPFAKVAAQIKG